MESSLNSSPQQFHISPMRKEQIPQININEHLIQMISSIYNDMRCGICHDLLEESLECSKCSKLFCKRCLITWRETNSASEMICPLKCERVQFIQPHMFTRKYINNFRDLENSLKKSKIVENSNLFQQSLQQVSIPSNENRSPNVRGASRSQGANENQERGEFQQNQRNGVAFEEVQTLEVYIEKLRNHVSNCETIQVSCVSCKDCVFKKELANHELICSKSTQSLSKCSQCQKEYDPDQELKHYNKECEKSVDCKKCFKKYNRNDDKHDCVQYLLKYQDEKKRNKKMLRKKNEKLQQMFHQSQKKYKELIRNEGQFCSFCEVPLNRQEIGLMFCRYCHKTSCKVCRYENMFSCFQCKFNFCYRCSGSKKVLICDEH